MAILLVVYVMLFGWLIVASYLPQYRKYYLIIKSTTSFMFVLVAYFMMKDEWHFLWMLAFIFCFMGDVLLGMDEKKDKAMNFVAGLSSFVFAHLLFLYHFQLVVPFRLSDMIFPFLMLGFVFVLISLPKFHVHPYSTPLFIYAFLISLLLVKGIDLFSYSSKYGNVMLGTMCFVISDFILLFVYFYQDKIRILKLLNLFFYYLAVILLALSRI